MRVLGKIIAQFDRRRDARIIACLRIYGMLVESELLQYTALKPKKLQIHLHRLAQHGLVSYDQNSRGWKIHHPRIANPA